MTDKDEGTPKQAKVTGGEGNYHPDEPELAEISEEQREVLKGQHSVSRHQAEALGRDPDNPVMDPEEAFQAGPPGYSPTSGLGETEGGTAAEQENRAAQERERQAEEDAREAERGQQGGREAGQGQPSPTGVPAAQAPGETRRGQQGAPPGGARTRGPAS